MRYRILATYRGAPYEAGLGPDESDVVLFAACPPPEDLRFEPATGHWRKQVNRIEVHTLYEARPVGMFRGERCVVLDDLIDRLHIVYLGHDALRAAQLGYWEVDRGVFELITPRHEVTDIVEQRLPLRIRSDSGQHTRPSPLPNTGEIPITRGPDPVGVGYGGFAAEQPSSVGYPAEPPMPRLPRPDASPPGPADRSDVALPTVAEAPLPLEAQALRAATTAARRNQKGSHARPAQEPRPPKRAPSKAGQAPAAPLMAPPAPAPAAPLMAPPAPGAAAPLMAPPAPVAVPAQSVSGPDHLEPVAPTSPGRVPPPVPAMLSQAAMLSRAAAAAGMQKAGSPAASQPAPPAKISQPAEPVPAIEPNQLTEPAQPAKPVRPAETVQRAEPVQPAEPVQRAETVQRAEPVQPAQPEPAASVPVAESADSVAAPVGASPEMAPQPPVSPAAPTFPAPQPEMSAEPVQELDREIEPEPQAAPVADRVDEAQLTPTTAQALAQPIGISDPPPVSNATSAPAAIPSWTPFQMGSAVPAADAVDEGVQPGHYAPYPPMRDPSQNGTATQNGTPLGHPVPQPVMPGVHAADHIEAEAASESRPRRSTKRRLPTQKIFSDLAAQAAIPATAYAIGEDVDGAMCLVRTDEGFEVFNAAAGSRHEVRVFSDEESAYFYLFGVLVADAVRTGALAPRA